MNIVDFEIKHRTKDDIDAFYESTRQRAEVEVQEHAKEFDAELAEYHENMEVHFMYLKEYNDFIKTIEGYEKISEFDLLTLSGLMKTRKSTKALNQSFSLMGRHLNKIYIYYSGRKYDAPDFEDRWVTIIRMPEWDRCGDFEAREEIVTFNSHEEFLKFLKENDVSLDNTDEDGYYDLETYVQVAIWNGKHYSTNSDHDTEFRELLGI